MIVTAIVGSRIGIEIRACSSIGCCSWISFRIIISSFALRVIFVIDNNFHYHHIDIQFHLFNAVLVMEIYYVDL
jgi:hypothetical protein